MQNGFIVLVHICRVVDAGQMISIEDNGDWLVHLVELIKEIRRFLVGPVNSFSVGIDIPAFPIR